MAKKTRYNAAYLTVEIERPFRYAKEITRAGIEAMSPKATTPET